MPRYEVESADETFEVSGDTWLIALSRALARVGKDVSALGRLSIALDRAGAVSARHPEEGWDMRLCPVEDVFGGEDDVLGWLPAPAVMVGVPARNAPLPPAPVAPPPAPEPPASPPSALRPVLSLDNLSTLRADPPRPADLNERLAACKEHIFDALDHDEASALACRALEELVPADSGAVLLFEPDGSLKFRAAFGPVAAGVLGTRLPPQSGVGGFCAATGLAVMVEQATKDARHDKSVGERLGYATRNLLAVPVRGGNGTLLGCLELLNAPQMFREWHLEAARAIAAGLSARLLSE
jgi:hypothetical protein